MVHPLVNQYAVSVIQKENNYVSLHLIHTYGPNMDYLDSSEYYGISPAKRGTWLEHTTMEEFPLANPMIAKNETEVSIFMNAALKWAKDKIQSVEDVGYSNPTGGYDGDMLLS